MNRTSLEEDSVYRVKGEPHVDLACSGLESAAQGALFILFGGLFMTLVAISVLAFGL